MKAWKDYNSNLLKNTIKFINENKNSNFNSEEQRCYSHVRDLVAITIANIDKDKLKILDYGSNTMPWSNIQNKIDLEKIIVTIFDPFADNDYTKNIDFGFPISIVKDISNFNIDDFDIILFGSSSQYINDFYEKIVSNSIKFPKLVFFLDTPFSLNGNYNLKQIDQSKREFTVFIRSYSRLIKIMEEKGYRLIFKSSLPWETQEFIPKKLFSKIKILNLLFEKQICKKSNNI